MAVTVAILMNRISDATLIDQIQDIMMISLGIVQIRLSQIISLIGVTDQMQRVRIAVIEEFKIKIKQMKYIGTSPFIQILVKI